MAPRPFWKGYLKLSLVTCPVTMTPAISASDRVRFSTVNRKTGNSANSRYVDAETGKVVADQDEAKGFQYNEDRLVIVEDEELDAVTLESTRTIDIDMFVPRDSIEWIWFDRPHYLAPSDKIGEEAFAVIREAMRSTGMAGVSRLVLYRRERAVMLEPRDQGIVVWTLRYGDEVRDEKPYFDQVEAKADSEATVMVQKLIKASLKRWTPDMVTDPVQGQLKKIIAAKKKKKTGKTAPDEKAKSGGKETTNVVSIMDALRKSISQEKPKRR